MPDWVLTAAGIVFGLCVLYFAVRIVLKRLRRALLVRQFEDEAMVDVIMDGRIAQGMTADMVIASWGEPVDLDETVMKTKTKAEMKYDQKGKNRYGTRVYLENGLVVGWETK